MEELIVITMPGEILFAGPVIETALTARQDLHNGPVNVPTIDADYAFSWASDDADEGAVEHDLTIQVWRIRSGEVIEYSIAQP